MIHIHCNNVSLVIRHCLPWILYPLEYSDWEMLQLFICVLADSFVIVRITTVIFGIVARNKT
jgi:hypothetical protein